MPKSPSPLTFEEERAQSRARRSDDARLSELRARTVRSLAQPGATRQQLEDAARAQYPRLGEQERADVVDRAEQDQERDQMRVRPTP